MIVEPLPYIPPAEAFAPLAGRAGAQLFCGGAAARESWGGQWAYVLGTPTGQFVLEGECLQIDGREVTLTPGRGPFEHLQRYVQARGQRAPLGADAFDGLAPPAFQGGLAGFIAYEAARWLEPVLRLPPADGPLSEIALMAYDAVVCFHEAAQKAFVIGRTQQAIDQLKEELTEPSGASASFEAPSALAAAHSAATYRNKVAEIKAAIRRGDIFQANLTQQLRASFSGDMDLKTAMLSRFQNLKSRSSAGYMALLQMEGGSVLSNSPENYFTLEETGEGRLVTAQPVKGTRARTVDTDEDARIARELLSSEKDRAENIMIADLVRNDLSRICQDHSIEEKEICALRSYGHVHHLVSIISGTLREGVDAIDVLKATFPCGSITGAPKIRAIEIIAEAEGEGRGVYCGAIGFIDDGGAAVFSVPIRTGFADHDARTFSYGTGGGITILSDEAEEYQETLIKAATFFELTGTRPEDLT